MATKKKSKKSETTERGGRKGAPVAGSPVTIGGGGGLVPVNLFIEFIYDDWRIVSAGDPAKRRLELKNPMKGVRKIRIEAGDVKVVVPVRGAPEIEITYS
jgi:hypothetical protein